jgi:hypothetical protein
MRVGVDTVEMMRVCGEGMIDSGHCVWDHATLCMSVTVTGFSARTAACCNVWWLLLNIPVAAAAWLLLEGSTCPQPLPDGLLLQQPQT